METRKLCLFCEVNPPIGNGAVICTVCRDKLIQPKTPIKVTPEINLKELEDE